MILKQKQVMRDLNIVEQGCVGLGKLFSEHTLLYKSIHDETWYPTRSPQHMISLLW